MNARPSASPAAVAPDNLRTVNDLFLRVASRNSPCAQMYQNEDGQWLPISSAQFYQRVRALALCFDQWGLKPGDRVAILSENRWEWAVADFACLAIGLVDVPIYPTLTSGQIGELMRDSAARVILVSSHAQYDKVAEIRSSTQLERVVMMDDPGLPEDLAAEAISFAALMAGTDALGSQRDEAFDRRALAIDPSSLATLIYTSGTTGEPKGVMLTHANLASNTNYSTREFPLEGDDALCLSFLPLSHITARALDYACYLVGRTVAYCPSFDKLPTAMRQVRPTLFVGVPRVYEKIRQSVEQKSAASPVKARILRWAVGLGAAHRDTILNLERPSAILWRLANKLVYSKIADAFGGRVCFFLSGGAPLGLDTGNWFASVGIAVYEGYGLTETSPVIAINTPSAHRMGSVGLPLPNVECRLAIDDELLVRGPSIFQGYWHKPQATQESFDADGWFRTGDIAAIDGDGFLFITDRKKELLKTSGGKLIAPQPIESKLKSNLLVANAALVGDKHKFISVLISPNFAALEDWARNNGISAATRGELVAHPRVVALYAEVVAQVNKGLATFESLKRFQVVPEEWALDSGELTPSLKLKRRIINERYAGMIAALYADEATSRA